MKRSYQIIDLHFQPGQRVEFRPEVVTESWANRLENIGISGKLLVIPVGLLVLASVIPGSDKTIVYFVTTYLKPAAEAADAVSTDPNFKFWLLLLQFVIFASVLIFLGVQLMKPQYRSQTHLKFGDDGLWSEARARSGEALITEMFSWSDVTRVSLFKPKGRTSSGEAALCFHLRNEHGGKIESVAQLKLEHIINASDWPRVGTFLRRYLDWRIIDTDVLATLERTSKRESFTELWMQELSATPFRQQLSPLRPGHTLNQGIYKVDQQLGIGGQGTVYLATTQKPDSITTTSGQVAIKEFILPLTSDSRSRQREAQKFSEEAKLLSKLDHPQIVRLYDAFIEDHRGYLVLERVGGKSLSLLLKERGRFAEQTVRELAVQMCDILTYLHSQPTPIIHRDFTPDNLIMNQDGKLTLIDFSVADSDGGENSQNAVGKPSYMAPEQFRGESTVQSDLYGLGATLHALLCGEDPEPLSESHPGSVVQAISSELDQIVARCTATKREDRFQSAGEIAQALTADQFSGPSQTITIKKKDSERLPIRVDREIG